jgi:HlyD family secretion protein
MPRKASVSVLIALAVMLGLGAGYAVLHRDRGALILSGNVDIRDLNLSFRVGGRLKFLRVDEGATVHLGDVLGELDPQPFKIAVSDAVANHAALAARLALVRAGYRAEDVAQAQANARAREAALADAEQLYQRQKALAGTGATTDRAVDDARLQRDQAAALLEAARQSAQALERGFRPEEVAEATANAARARAQVEQAQLQLADTQLVAPADATVLTRAVEPGSMLTAGATVLSLSLDRPVWVRAYVGESDLGRVAPGTRVRIQTDTRMQAYEGTVGFVSPTAEFTPKTVETQDLRTDLVYRLRVIVDKPDAQLRQGMPVTVRLAAPDTRP